MNSESKDSLKRLRKRIGAFLLAPLLFLCFGYLLFYVIGQPVIQFITTSADLMLLSRPPVFNQAPALSFSQDMETTSEDVSEESEVKEDIPEEEEEEPLSGEFAIKSSELEYPETGTQYGMISVERLDIQTPLFLGDTNDILRMGAGQSLQSIFPGEFGGTLVGGHNNQGFGKFANILPEDQIKVETTYGTYIYEVTETQIKRFDDPTAIEILRDKTKRTLILYTCYPLESIGVKNDRLLVYADLISGPLIDENN